MQIETAKKHLETVTKTLSSLRAKVNLLEDIGWPRETEEQFFAAGAYLSIKRAARTNSALTTTVDIFATLCDIFGVSVDHRTHGHSLVPLVRGETSAVREYVLTGVWGRAVQIVHDQFKYVRAPRNDNRPLSMWSNRWSTMPIHALPNVRLPKPDHRATLDYMPGSSVPVIRQPFEPGDAVPFWAMTNTGQARDLLFDVVGDPLEDRDLTGTDLTEQMEGVLRSVLHDIEAPVDQFQRLGL